jgi:thiamine-phosphate pyrophosphorylase
MRCQSGKVVVAGGSRLWRYIDGVQGLYAIVDAQACARRAASPVAVADAILSAGPALLQLRAKDLGARETLDLLREIAPRCREAGVPLIANDRPDLALLAGCAGVHLGQDDLPSRDVRALADDLGRKLTIGVSTHDAADVERAIDEPIDLVAVGPVFGTTSKARPEPTVGIEAALALAATFAERRPRVTRVAIGGIDEATAAQLRVGFDLVAVIGALLPADGDAASFLDGVRQRARRLVEAARRADA